VCSTWDPVQCSAGPLEDCTHKHDVGGGVHSDGVYRCATEDSWSPILDRPARCGGCGWLLVVSTGERRRTAGRGGVVDVAGCWWCLPVSDGGELVAVVWWMWLVVGGVYR